MNKIFKIRILAGKVCLILTALLAVQTSQISAQTIEYAIIRDVSESSNGTQLFDADYLFKKIIAEFDLRGSDQGVNLRTIICGERRIPEIRLATLPEQTSIFGSSSERTNDLRQFLTKAKSDLDYLASKERKEQQTNLFRSLVGTIQGMDSLAQKKTVVIFSDGIEVSSVLNAEKKYAQNPSSIIDDYDAIIKAFNIDLLVPDFYGIEVIFVTPASNDLELWMSRFWWKFITSRGGSVTLTATF